MIIYIHTNFIFFMNLNVSTKLIEYLIIIIDKNKKIAQSYNINLL
jgi:hypothetical protein